MTPLNFSARCSFFIAGVLVISNSVVGQADSPAVKPETHSDLLKGWTAETFSLPPTFAPELPTGHESLRFAPGWRDPKAADFWSYAFVMWIDEPAPDSARMKELLEKYYDGLLASFAADKKKDISKTPARVEVVRTAPNQFEAKMRVIDAFATFEPIELRIVIDSQVDAAGRSVLRIQVSPRPKEHAIWQALERATAAIVSQDGALQKKKDNKAADPMATFARMIGGEWNGTSGLDSWTWGPGKHSIRGGELEVMYWHPGRKEVCLLNLHSDIPGVGRAAGEGTIKFEGETASGVLDLYQPRGRRKLATRWTFNGPDKYHDVLLEDTGSGFKPLAAWDRFRVPKRSETRPRTGKEAPKLPELLKALEPLLSRTWDAKIVWGGKAGEALHIETTLVPLADGIYARSYALRGNGTPVHALDAFIYHQPGTERLRCLALFDLDDMGETEGVYEGDLTVLDGGALQLELKGYEGDRVVPLVMRVDFEKDGTLRQRVWSTNSAPASKGGERALKFDTRHTASPMSKNIMTIFQDSKQNYWFGSHIQGLYRYDGKTITHFTEQDGLTSNRIDEIQEDKAGNIYFASASGISKFDGQTFTTLVPARSGSPDNEWKLAPDDLWFKGVHGIGEVCRYDGTSLHGLDLPKSARAEEWDAQNPRSQYPFASSPSSVYTIYKDRKGNIWFGTGAAGACRYDGKSFLWVSEDDVTEFHHGPANGVRSIIEDRDGKFWFSNNLYRYDVYGNTSPDKHGDERGATAKGYIREKGIGSLDPKKAGGFDEYMSAARDANGELWIVTWGAGVWRYDGTNIAHYPVMDGDNPITLFSIYKDRRGDLWLGTHEHGVYRFNGKKFESIPFPERPGQPARPEATKSPKDELKANALDTEGLGVKALDPINEPANPDPYFTPIGAKTTSTMPQVIIRNMREDRAGNIWFATFGGPIRYDGKNFTNFSEEVGLAKRRIFSLLVARSGALWFGSITGGASRYDGKSFTRFTNREGLGDNDVTWIFEDRDANIWFGTGNGASRYDGKSMTNFTTKDGLVDNSVYAIAQDAAGKIWFGTQGGICSYDGKSFSNLADKVGRTFVNVRAIVVDRSENLWFGGQEGAFRYDGETLENFTTEEGMLDGFVGSMIVDRAGHIWLGHPGNFPAGSGGGASRYDGKSFKHFTQKDGLGSATVYSMLEDKAGNIWFGSVDAGACRYDGKAFTYFSVPLPTSSPAQSKQSNSNP